MTEGICTNYQFSKLVQKTQIKHKKPWTQSVIQPIGENWNDSVGPDSIPVNILTK